MSDSYSFGTDYGKDVLADLNKLAHTAGTDAVRRDAFQRAYREIERLRAALKWYSEASPQQLSADGGQYAIAALGHQQQTEGK